MLKTHSTSSFGGNNQPINSTQQLLLMVNDSLQQAYHTLPSSKFQTLLRNSILSCIRRAQTDLLSQVFSPYVSKWVHEYGGDVQLNARALLLETVCRVSDNYSAVQPALNKAKHLVIDTPHQYLLTKIFLVQAKVHSLNSDFYRSQKSLKKVIQYCEQYAVNFLKETDAIRKEIVDSIIIANFQLFKLNKDSKINEALQFLTKAHNATLKNYGSDHVLTHNLMQTLEHHSLRRQLQSKNRKCASTLVCQSSWGNNQKLVISYLWEQELIKAQLFVQKYGRTDTLTEVKHPVCLDKQKIQRLGESKDWFYVNENDDIIIDEEELLRTIGLLREPKAYLPTLKNFSKEELAKKQQVSSSSDNSQQLFPRIQFNGLLPADLQKQHTSRSRHRREDSF